MHERGVVTYVDAQSKRHDALVRTINPMHPGFLTLVYLNDAGEALTVFDVAHADDKSRGNLREVLANGPTAEHGNVVIDGNPDLPQYDHNCWLDRDEEHAPLPADHPAFDHPFKQPEFDQSGNRIPVVRTEYERQIAQHRAASQADGYAPLPEGEPDPAITIETKHYTDGSSATGPAPLPDQSPAQQDAAEGKPSGADLDKDAEEKSAKDATAKPGIRVVKGSKAK